MPLLGGLFGRKNKSSSRSVAGTSSVYSSAGLDSTSSSPTTSYVTPDNLLPSSPNGQNSLRLETSHLGLSPSAPASSSKLRLPFGRKKSSKVSINNISTATVDQARPTYLDRLSTSSAATNDTLESDSPENRRLRPPPSKSAIFAAYADPNSALSTRSLPAHAYARPQSETPPPLPVKQKKRPLFPWNKSTASAPSITNPQPNSPPDDDASSFNLKSFRHVRAPSPTNIPLPPTPTNNTPLPLQAGPRPRGMSSASDAQRISVAAFREAQARRSAAGSPAPSFRSPSPLPPVLISDAQAGGRGSPRPSRSSPHVTNSQSWVDSRRRTLYDSDSDEDASDEELDSDDDEDRTQRPGIGRKRTITQRSNTGGSAQNLSIGTRKSKSEVGHGTKAKSEIGHSVPMPSGINRNPLGMLNSPSASDISSPPVSRMPVSPPDIPPPRSQSNLGHYRTRASASTSAISPSGAAKRASILATANDTGPSASIGMYNTFCRNIYLTKLAVDVKKHRRTSSAFASSEVPSFSGLSQPAMSSRTGETSISKPTSTNIPPISNTVSKTASAVKLPLPTDSDSDSDDDAPLATLVAPRRPGSALSSYSSTNGSHSNLNSSAALGAQSKNNSQSVYGRVGNIPNVPTRFASKPLVDINQIISRGPIAEAFSPKDQEKKANDDAFTGGPTLLSNGDKKSSSDSRKLLPNAGTRQRSLSIFSQDGNSLLEDSRTTSSQDLVESPLSSPHLSSTVPPRFKSPPATPVKELEAFFTQPQVKKQTVDAQDVKRDALKDRLTKVVGKKVGSGSSGSSIGSAKEQSNTLPTGSSYPKAPSELGHSNEAEQSHISVGPLPELGNDSPGLGQFSFERSSRRVSFEEKEPAWSADFGLRMGQQQTIIKESADRSLTPQPVDTRHRRIPSDVGSAISTSTVRPSPPDEDLASMLGASIRLISRTGDSSEEDEEEEEESESESSDEEAWKTKTGTQTVRKQSVEPKVNQPTPIAPIPIKQRAPPTAFAVTSRPPLPRSVNQAASSGSTSSNLTDDKPIAQRQRSSSLIPSPASKSSFGTSPPSSHSRSPISASSASSISSTSQAPANRENALKASNLKQRPNRIVPVMPVPSLSPGSGNAPPKPFAARRDSPASSAGDSSSGRAPLTPRDGSDIGVGRNDRDREKGDWGSGVSGLGPRHMKRRSVVFEDDVVSGKGNEASERGPAGPEDKRKERRRNEAKAAIEVGFILIIYSNGQNTDI